MPEKLKQAVTIVQLSMATRIGTAPNVGASSDSHLTQFTFVNKGTYVFLVRNALEVEK